MDIFRNITKKDEAARLIHTITSVDISKLETSAIIELGNRFYDLSLPKKYRVTSTKEEIKEINKIIKVPTFLAGFSREAFEVIANLLFTYARLARQ